MSGEKKVYRGEWWLPSDREKRQPGQLVIESDGSCLLELVHAFPTMEYVAQAGTMAENIMPIDTYPVIHGESGGKAFALIDCRTRTVTDNVASDGRHHNISARRALVGVYWLDNSAERVFTGSQVQVDYLMDWSDLGGLSVQAGPEPSVTTGRSEPVAPLSARVGSINYELSLTRIGFHGKRDHPNLRSAVAEESAKLTITVKRARSLQFFDEVIKRIQDLLSICTDYPCAVRSETLAIPIDPYIDPSGRKYPQPLWNSDLFGELTFKADSVPYRDPVQRSLFSLNDLPFAQVMRRWTSLYDRGAVSLQLLAGTYYLPNTYIGVRVMSVCASLESLHREVFHPKRMDYVKRAEALAKYIGIDVTQKFLGDVRTWAEHTRDARNAMAHADDTKPMTSELQFRLFVVTRTMLRLVVGKKLGMTKAQLLAYLDKDQEPRFSANEFRILTGQIQRTRPVLGTRTFVAPNGLDSDGPDNGGQEPVQRQS